MNDEIQCDNYKLVTTSKLTHNNEIKFELGHHIFPD